MLGLALQAWNGDLYDISNTGLNLLTTVNTYIFNITEMLGEVVDILSFLMSYWYFIEEAGRYLLKTILHFP